MQCLGGNIYAKELLDAVTYFNTLLRMLKSTPGSTSLADTIAQPSLSPHLASMPCNIETKIHEGTMPALSGQSLVVNG